MAKSNAWLCSAKPRNFGAVARSSSEPLMDSSMAPTATLNLPIFRLMVPRSSVASERSLTASGLPP